MSNPWVASVSDFMSYFTKGYGRPSRFRVNFNMPAGVNPLIGNGLGFIDSLATSSAIAATQKQFNSGPGAINIMCNSATFPQRTLLSWDLNQNSAAFRVPYSFEYDPITFSFYADSTLNSRRYFEAWQSAAGNTSNNTMNYLSEFVAPVTITQLDSAGNDTYSVTLVDAWPTTVGSTELNMASTNAIHNVTVTMVYRSYTTSMNSVAIGSETAIKKVTQPFASARPSDIPGGTP